ncbi:MAG: exodeoxyribonuclease VII small subunit [Lachnospiraceae bacterium]|jgi:exodeoxyribonuclease VII small subunit|nr:exodeoxyribonuclease VII small subunit [Lachnospiraceae bacterium]
MQEEAQEKTLEELLGEIEDIVGQIQQNDISLEASFTLYQQGVEKLKQCNEKIDAVEKKLLLMNQKEQP